MTTGSILLGFALLVLAVLFVARPFLVPPARRAPRRPSRRHALLAQKEILLDEIRALDFDHDTGKIPDEVYQPQRAHLLAEATTILKQLDEVAGGKPVTSTSSAQALSGIEGSAVEQDVDAEIEAAVARLRSRQPKTKVVSTDGKGGFCTQCGQPTAPDDKFCAHCGHQLRTLNVE